MESCSIQKSVTQIKVYYIFEVLQKATLCLDDSFAHFWYFLNQLHLELFSNSLEGVTTYAKHLLAAFPSLCGPTHPKPSQFGWGWGIVDARSSDTALHHSLSWSNGPYRARRCVEWPVRPIVQRPMGLPIRAGCDTAGDESKVCSDASSTEMQWNNFLKALYLLMHYWRRQYTFDWIGLGIRWITWPPYAIASSFLDNAIPMFEDIF